MEKFSIFGLILLSNCHVDSMDLNNESQKLDKHKNFQLMKSPPNVLPQVPQTIESQQLDKYKAFQLRDIPQFLSPINTSSEDSLHKNVNMSKFNVDSYVAKPEEEFKVINFFSLIKGSKATLADLYKKIRSLKEHVLRINLNIQRIGSNNTKLEKSLKDQ